MVGRNSVEFQKLAELPAPSDESRLFLRKKLGKFALCSSETGGVERRFWRLSRGSRSQLWSQFVHDVTGLLIRVDSQIVEFLRVRVMIIKLDSVSTFTPLGISISVRPNAAPHDRGLESLVGWA